MENKTLAKFVSLHEDTCKDFTITEQDVIIGRKKTCGCKIPNTKISGEHCRIRLDTDSGVFTITDLSTNGTFVNDTKIKKDQPTVLNTEDRIYLLKDQAEDTQIGFIFIASFKAKRQASGLKRTRDEVDQEEEEDKQSFKRFKSDELDIEDQVKCSLCLEVMYKPVSLLPCLHNFCGGCYSGWIKKHDDCPECRGSINHIKQNKMLISMIHKYLEDHKKDEKTHESKQDQDKHDLFNKDITSFLNAKKLSSEGNKEEEKKSEEQKSRNKDGELSQNKCKSCKAAINGFKCDKNTDHQTCSACNEVFPISNKAGVNVQCIKCCKYFCHQQWKCKNFMKNKLGALNMCPFVGINQNSLNKNSFEQKILKDYIAKKKFSQMQFRDDILNKLETETWKIRDTSNKEQALKKTSTICMSCAPEIWDHIIYKYRETIKNELPPNITNRSDCWFGSKCRTQVHNQSHASKLNHICDCKK